MRKFLSFTKDILIEGIGFWIIPWIGATYVAFELYHQLKAPHGFEDFGLGWPLVVLALMLLFGRLVLGRRFQTVMDRHFPPST
jgi:hypothetical protein